MVFVVFIIFLDVLWSYKPVEIDFWPFSYETWMFGSKNTKWQIICRRTIFEKFKIVFENFLAKTNFRISILSKFRRILVFESSKMVSKWWFLNRVSKVGQAGRIRIRTGEEDDSRWQVILHIWQNDMSFFSLMKRTTSHTAFWAAQNTS